jgi:hypothetical protein
MRWDQLEKRFRADVRDTQPEYFFAPTWVKEALLEAEAEACVRGRLLHESDNESVCLIDVAAGVSAYPLHPALYEIDHIAFLEEGAATRKPVRLSSTEELDRTVIDWRDKTGPVDYAIQSDKSIRLALRPEKSGRLILEGYRLPVSENKPGPEIHSVHHLRLIDWVLHLAFLLPDSETIDLSRAAGAEARFTAYFGARPDSDLRRITREDVAHGNKAYWV